MRGCVTKPVTNISTIRVSKVSKKPQQIIKSKSINMVVLFS